MAPEDEYPCLAEENVADLFAKANKITLSEIGVSAIEADELIKSRVQKLRIFTRSGTPPEMREKYEAGVQVTTAAHELASALTLFPKEITRIHRFSEAKMYTIAAKIQNHRPHSELSVPVRVKMVNIRTELVYAIWDELDRSGPKRPLDQVVIEHFSGRSDNDLTQARIVAMGLEMQYSSQKNAIEAALLIALIALTCRGIFYRTIIEGQGSRLEGRAARAAFKDALDEVPGEIASHVPGIGALVGPVKVILDLAMSLVQKEAALEKMQTKIARSYAQAMEFIDTYSLAVTVWTEWASNVLSVVNRMCRNCIRVFSTIVDPQDEQIAAELGKLAAQHADIAEVRKFLESLESRD